MADNRIAYGIAKGMDINTDGMEPREVWQAIADKQGVSVEQAMRHAYAQKVRESLNKKITRASDELKKQSKMTAEEKIASVHIDFDRDNILPELNEEDLKDLGVSTNKSVLLKKNVIDRNELRHNDLTLEDSEKIISQALYSKDKTIIPSKHSYKPNYYTFAKIVRVSKKDGQPVYGVVLLDVDSSKENFEIVHWHYVPQDKLDSIKPRK